MLQRLVSPRILITPVLIRRSNGAGMITPCADKLTFATVSCVKMKIGAVKLLRPVVIPVPE